MEEEEEEEDEDEKKGEGEEGMKARMKERLEWNRERNNWRKYNKINYWTI